VSDPRDHITEPLHLPYVDGPWRHRMHVRPLDADGWFLVGPTYDADMAERVRVLADHRAQVLVMLDGSEPAAAEMLDAILTDLARHHPGLVDAATSSGGRTVRNLRTGEVLDRGAMHPVEVAGRLVQEDLLLLVPAPGGPVLGAACVCFPSRWDLPSKLGQPMRAIHSPVPRLNDQLGTATDAFLARLSPDKPVWRLAWSLIDRPELHQPAGVHRDPTVHGPIHAGNVADEVCFRVERETLTRFPVHGGVLFTIRTSVTPLSWFSSQPGEAARLAAAVRAIPDDVAGYKGVAPVREPVLAWLDSVAAGA
jgi:dimethylamine monooxygenase subunit A